jgi:hypothetical protein
MTGQGMGADSSNAPERVLKTLRPPSVGRRLLLMALLALAALPRLALSAEQAPQMTAQAPKAAPPSDSLPQITVQAQRHAIEERVHRFVNDFLYLENDEGPARWNSPVCPTVVGLPREEGEFMLQRLSQIARAAGVPLDSEQCKAPNLYVIATAHPAEVLAGWAKKTHGAIFGGATPTAVRLVIGRAAPVFAWYNSDQVGADGAPGAADLPDGLGFMTAQAGFSAPAFNNPRGASRLTRSVKWTFSSVIVVIDKAKLGEVTRGQLADYVGMQAFSRLKTGGRPGEAPTILGLFEGATAQSPPGMTAWDAAFLESLYHTDPALMQQRMSMVTRMVKHIVPETKADPASPP